MPIVARQPGLDTTEVPRSGAEAAFGVSAPPEDLLPSGGAHVLAPAPAPHRALALDALRLMRMLRGRRRDVGALGEPAFAREVDLIRSHLVPIRSRRSLASSFGREASLTPGLRVAYAVRWLELGDGVARAGWTELVTESA